MNATQKYLLGLVNDAVSKALDIGAESVVFKDGRVVITIDPCVTENPFWQAVKEQVECD